MWSFFVSKLSELIQYCYHLTDLAGFPNYGLAIILVTFIIKIILFPLNNSSMKSMRAMQEIQPKMKEIQERYRDTPEKMQAETMKLYKENKVNPFGGCLPLLVQMPFLIAFYQALVHFKYSVTAHAVFLWITAATTLSKPDPTYLLPILAGITTFIQQKLSTMDTKDPTQRTMLIFMPLMIAWMATKFAAGLALYWVVLNILSILQQMWINSRYKPAVVPGTVTVPVVEEEVEEIVSDKGVKNNAGSGKKRKKRR